MKRLSHSERMDMLNGMGMVKTTACRKMCGEGKKMNDTLKKIAKFLGPLAKKVGKKALKEWLLPWLKKKGKEKFEEYKAKKGMGITLAGGSLKLAGQGNPWISHVKKVQAEKGIPYKDAMKVAKLTYKK